MTPPKDRTVASAKPPPPPPPPPPPRPASAGAAGLPWLDIAGKSSVVTALVAAWLFLVGWLYAYYFFERFGIGVAALGLDLKILPLYGFLTLKAYWWVAALFFLAIVAIVWAVRRRPGQVPATVVLVLVILGLLAYFALGYVVATRNAGRVYADLVARDYPGYRRVQLWAKSSWFSDEALKPQATALAAAEACYRLIYAGPTALYVFKPVKGRTDLEPPVLVIPRGEVTAYRTLPNEDSCGI